MSVAVQQTQSPLRGRVVNALAWKGVSQIVLQASRIVVAVILARLLSPHDYGLAGMVVIFANLVIVFADFGFGSALVQRETISEEDRSSVFWFCVTSGALFAVAGVLAAGPIAAFYGQPEVRPLMMVFSLTFFVVSLGATQTALLTRELDFRTLELRAMAGAVAGAVVGIWLAASGFGAWAIIGQQLAVATTSTVLLWIASSWRPHFVFSRNRLAAMSGFSRNVLGTRVLFFANRNADNLLIGKFVGPAALGVYSLAYTIMLVPFSQIASPIQEVLFPTLSRMGDDVARMRAAWLRANRLIAAVAIPSLAGMIVVAPAFVETILGPRWHSAVPVIRILAWVGLMQSLQRLNSSVLQARNITGPLFRFSVIALVSSLIAFAVGLHWGIAGIAVGYAISSTLIEPYYMWLTTSALESTLREFGRSLLPVVEATGLMLAAVLIAQRLLPRAVSSPSLTFFAVVIVGVVAYLPAVAWRAPELVDDVRSIRRRRLDPVPSTH